MNTRDGVLFQCDDTENKLLKFIHLTFEFMCRFFPLRVCRVEAVYTRAFKKNPLRVGGGNVAVQTSISPISVEKGLLLLKRGSFAVRQNTPRTDVDTV